MNADRFDSLTRLLATSGSRRRMFGGLLAAIAAARMFPSSRASALQATGQSDSKSNIVVQPATGSVRGAVVSQAHADANYQTLADYLHLHYQMAVDGSPEVLSLFENGVLSRSAITTNYRAARKTGMLASLSFGVTTDGTSGAFAIVSPANASPYGLVASGQTVQPVYPGQSNTSNEAFAKAFSTSPSSGPLFGVSCAECKDVCSYGIVSFSCGALSAVVCTVSFGLGGPALSVVCALGLGAICGLDAEACPGACTSTNFCCPDESSTPCSDGCHSFATDHQNCGGCGILCLSNQQCVNSQCITGATCPNGQTACSAQCVDTTSDSLNCSQCGHKCDPGTQCVNSQCVTSATGTIVVSLEDSSSSLLPGAAWELLTDPSGACTTYITELRDDADGVADGITHFSNIPAGSYKLWQTQTTAPQFAPAYSDPFSLAAGETLPLVLHPVVGATITVAFQSADGSQFAATPVTFSVIQQNPPSCTPPWIQSFEPNQANPMVFPGVSPGTYQFHIENAGAAGYAPATDQAVTVASGDSVTVTFTLTPSATQATPVT